MATFTDDQLTYAAFSRCPCGAGMAYGPEDLDRDGPFVGPSYWDCSDILTGRAIPSGQPGSVKHEAKLPFAFYKIKSEGQPSAHGATTRPDGGICECGLAKSYHDGRLRPPEEYRPRYPRRPTAEMAATAGEDDDLTRAGRPTLWSRLRAKLRRS